MTRLPRNAEQDEAIVHLCRKHPQNLDDYRKRPAHRSVLTHLIALGLAAPDALE